MKISAEQIRSRFSCSEIIKTPHSNAAHNVSRINRVYACTSHDHCDREGRVKHEGLALRNTVPNEFRWRTLSVNIDNEEMFENIDTQYY